MTRAKRQSRSKTDRPIHKERKSFTLSPESVALLNELRIAPNGKRKRSVSAVLDSLLQRLRAERKRQAIERAIADYYDDRPEELHSEEEAWGDFSLLQLLAEDN